MEFLTNQYISDLASPFFVAINAAMDSFGSLEDTLLWAYDDESFQDIFDLWMNK